MSKDRFDELSTAEQKIIFAIKNDPVPLASQEDILTACKVASSYYAENQSIWDKRFWKVTLSCFSLETAFFWILSAFLLGSCVVISLLATEHGVEPMALMSAISPVPVIAFAIRELQYRDSNLVQIEKTCKYAPQNIYFARLWLGMFVNAIWVLLAGAIVFFKYETFAQLYFCSFIAMFLIGGIALMLMSISDNALPLSLVMAAWILGAYFLVSSDEFIRVITTMGIGMLAVITFFSFGLFAAATVKATTKLYA
jgi:hypothetical protein